ncbi:MAG: hypothetical protein DMF89_04885 [Acidobacteria bacterium]|nr:MAG: hypothetical protein DMF90_19745 [Acidobacteriota bacterium]PYR51739.1 MAG: hypothetical protein DMF89_04885 [Acidobacteriota bacterium]
MTKTKKAPAPAPSVSEALTVPLEAPDSTVGIVGSRAVDIKLEKERSRPGVLSAASGLDSTETSWPAASTSAHASPRSESRWAEVAMVAVVAAAAMVAVGSSRLMQQWETPRTKPETAIASDVTEAMSASTPAGDPAPAKTPTNGRRFTPAPPPPQEVRSAQPSPGGTRPPVQPKTVRPPTPSTETASASGGTPGAPPPAAVETPAPRPAVEPPAPPQGPFFEPSDVTESPRVATRVELLLPEAVRNRPINDVVVVRLLVSNTGHPSRVSLLRRSRAGQPVDDAVIAAVNQWTFSPARKKGQAVSCWFNLGVPIRSNESG